MNQAMVHMSGVKTYGAITKSILRVVMSAIAQGKVEERAERV